MGGESLCEPVHLHPPHLPPPTQAVRHLRPTAGFFFIHLLVELELPQDRTGPASQAGEQSTTEVPLCCSVPSHQISNLFGFMGSADDVWICPPMTQQTLQIDFLLSAGANNSLPSLSLMWVAAQGCGTGNITVYDIAIKWNQPGTSFIHQSKDVTVYKTSHLTAQK